MIRLILLIILLLISLLTVFKAPAYYLWLLAVAVSEFPAAFICITLVVLAMGFWVQKYQLASMLTGIAALLLFMSPIVRAYIVGATLKKNFSAVFGEDSTSVNSDNKPPFTFSNMFAGKPKPIAAKALTYVTYADTSLTLDFYPAQAEGKRPCVIIVHGGSWSSGDSKQLPELNNYLAIKGYQVASINYRMAPQYKSPAPVEDVQATLNYLHQRAAELKIDTNQFILLGRSAGAQIALLAAYTLHGKGIKAVIDFYGPADMVWGYSVPANPLVMDSRKVMENYLGGAYQEMPQNYAASSPVEFVNRQTVPTLIIHGGNDVLVAYEHSTRLDEKLRQNGVKHFWLQLPWATHGFDFNINGPGGQLSTYTVEHFLKAVTTK
jgi:acetyl esterase/lipase